MMFGEGLAMRDEFDDIFMDYRDESEVTTEIRWNDLLLMTAHERIIVLISLTKEHQSLQLIRKSHLNWRGFSG